MRKQNKRAEVSLRAVLMEFHSPEDTKQSCFALQRSDSLVNFRQNGGVHRAVVLPHREQIKCQGKIMNAAHKQI